MNITIIGTGYVGLVSGTCFSDFGFPVTCVDIDQSKITRLNALDIPIYEPGLKELVAKNLNEGRLSFTTDMASAVSTADVVFIAVGTPSEPGTGAVDMSWVDGAAETIAGALQDFTVVVTKSTVPVGTARRLAAIISKANPDADFAMASNPEFLREGSAIEDFFAPDRVVVGVEDARAAKYLRALYAPLKLEADKIMFTGFETAEMIKYAANAYLATRIGFVNELANLCEKADADITLVTRAMGTDQRIGPHFLQPGPAFGGSCFPKDTRAFAAAGRAYGAELQVVEATIASNEIRKHEMVDKIRDAFGGSVEGKRVAVLGISFKANTDDLREAASLTIIPQLQAEGAEVLAHDPLAGREARERLPDVTWCTNPEFALNDADGVVILTEWDQFRQLDMLNVSKLMRGKVIVDLRNIFNPVEMRKLPFEYHSLGRQPVVPEVDPNWLPTANEVADILQMHRNSSIRTTPWRGERRQGERRQSERKASNF
ncbi:MAG: UDP-glucose/GDP-mannose dehydrogenase family protein [Alphaproteobacteria bacterium]|nr:UDP-glucose/GDP-mannose dehydrogenase family protein [Alphaproteobacteria bacterium]